MKKWIVIYIGVLLTFAACNKEPEIATSEETLIKTFEYKLVSRFISDGDYFYGLSIDESNLYFTKIEKNGKEINRFPISEYLPKNITNIDTFLMTTTTELSESMFRDGVLFEYRYYDESNFFNASHFKMKIDFNGNVKWALTENQDTLGSFIAFVEKSDETILRIHQYGKADFTGNVIRIDEMSTAGKIIITYEYDVSQIGIDKVIGFYNNNLITISYESNGLGKTLTVFSPEMRILTQAKLFDGYITTHRVFPMNEEFLLFADYTIGFFDQGLSDLFCLNYDGSLKWSKTLTNRGPQPFVYACAKGNGKYSVIGTERPNNMFSYYTFYPERSPLYYKQYDLSGSEISSDTLAMNDFGIGLGTTFSNTGTEHILLAKKIFNQYPGLVLYKNQ